MLGAAGAVAVGSLAGCLGFGGGGGSGSLPDSGDQELLSSVESFPSEGNDHVQQGSQIDYARMPPTSGPHYSSTVSAGFYSEPQPLGGLVHTLEHGAIVAYYDPQAITDEARKNLKQLANTHTGTWRSFVAVPYPYENPESAYTLTAWRHRLRMDEYSAETVRAFTAEYLGRGPENPVR